MPHFVAPLAGHSRLTGELFVLDCELPDSGILHSLSATICPAIEKSFIGPGLAARLGLNADGGEAMVLIKQWSTLTGRLHVFDLIPLRFRLAHARLGENYVGLGIEALEHFFELHLWNPQSDENPSPPFIFLEPWSQYRHWCRQVA